MIQTTLTQPERRRVAGLAALGRLLHAEPPVDVDALPLREESEDEQTPPPASSPEARGSGGQVDK